MTSMARDRRASPFSRAGVLAILLVGAASFIALLYFLSVGDTGPDDSQNGRAHAAANGLNGYSALTKLVEASGMDATLSREQSGLETTDLLVLTPPNFADTEELENILSNREYLGPTLVILPKWNALEINRLFEVAEPEKVKDGWVFLGGISTPRWADRLSGPYGLDIEEGGLPGANDTVRTGEEPEGAQSWRGRGVLAGLSGALPSAQGYYTQPLAGQRPLVVDQAGRAIALGLDQQDYIAEDPEEEPLNWVVFVIEPDLVNNWGLADQARAEAAMTLIREMGYGDTQEVVFDLTLNGFGGAMNLLTLAFRPPFLAATLCLLLAIVIIGWRAFHRFGPSAISLAGQSFGKARLVTNGADLIVRAGRLKLLAEPYIDLSARRLARSLGLAKPDPTATDASLAARSPEEPSFSARANELRAATKATDILRAASALNAINRVITTKAKPAP